MSRIVTTPGVVTIRIVVVGLLLAACASPTATTASPRALPIEEAPPATATAVAAPTEPATATAVAAPTEPATATAVAAPTEPAAPTAVPTAEAATPARPGVEAYRGLGAWVDVFDWAPAYAGPNGPAVAPADLDDMAALGVSTIYFQTSRIDDRGRGAIQNEPLVAEFLARAHDLDIAVVGWFLPKWEDAEEDLNRLVAIANFDVEGQRFDGVAVDIEGVPTPEQRADWNLRLVALSEQLRDELGDRALGAIVLPPTLIEVVNPEYWPNFPWAELAPLYDVWLPMSYWSFRDDDDSPFANGYSYNADATQRLRINLGNDAALVHAIGGIGTALVDDGGGEPLATVDELGDFVQSAVDTSAIGISIYDWASQDPVGRETLAELVQATPLSN